MNKEETIWAKLVDVVQIIDAKLSRIEGDMKVVKKDLKYHIHRTNKLEAHINNIEDTTIKPLQNDLLKFKIILGMVCTIGIGLAGLLGWLINILLNMKNVGIL